MYLLERKNFMKRSNISALFLLMFGVTTGCVAGVVTEAKENKDLLRAILHEDIDKAREALKDGADVNARDSEGWTALHWAASGRSVEIVRLLLKAGADINAQDNTGSTALIWAVNPINMADSETETVKLLLENGANVDTKNNRGETALIEELKSGNTDCITLLLKAHADVNVQDNDGATALHYAASGRSVEIVRLLLKAGADVNTKDKKGKTALMQTAPYENVEIVKLLLNAGANVNAKNNLGLTVLKMERVNPEVRKVIQDFIDPLNRALLEAAKIDSYDGVTKALKKGAEVDTKDEKGNTALHLVAEVSKITAKDISRRLDRAALITSLLLSKHASLVTNNAGETAVYRALSVPDSPLVKIYEEYAAKRPDVKKALEEARAQQAAEVKKDY